MLRELRHIFKLDPEKYLSEYEIERICTSGSDGIIIGGTDGVTFDNTTQLVRSVRSYNLPVFQEVSSVESLVPGFDKYLIPIVLNAQDPYWIFTAHKEAIKDLGSFIPWEDCEVEGYIILNEDSKAAAVTQADCFLSTEDVIAYAQLAENLLHLPYVYIEYSGRYGDPQLVKKVAQNLKHSHLIYGGGIRSREQALEMSSFATTIVIGNIIYEDLQRALDTVIHCRAE